MILFCFAHYLEAKSFITSFQAMSIELPRTPSLSCYYSPYQNQHFYFLITGEGPFEASNNLTAAICQLPAFDLVLNFGVAGDLTKSLIPHQIYLVRSTYLHDKGDFHFKSFFTPNSLLAILNKDQKPIDCITCFERVFETKIATKLSLLGQLIDRELWGLLSSAKKLKVPLMSFKIISDQINDHKQCDLVKEKAKNFSDLLLNDFLKNIFPKISQLIQICNEEDHKKTQEDAQVNSFINKWDDQLYFTTSSKHQFTKLIRSIHQNDEEKIMAEIDKKMELLSEKKLRPKEKTKELLEHLSKGLSYLPKEYQEPCHV